MNRNAYETVEVQLYSFSTTGLNLGVINFTPHFTSWKMVPTDQWRRGWVGSKLVQRIWRKEKPLLLPAIENQILVMQSVASCYTLHDKYNTDSAFLMSPS